MTGRIFVPGADVFVHEFVDTKRENIVSEIPLSEDVTKILQLRDE